MFALDRPRPELHDRINRRVAAMFDAGLVEEVRGLQALGRPLSHVAAQGVGYLEVLDMLAGKGRTWPRRSNAFEARSRQFAKRQATWFRGPGGGSPLAGVCRGGPAGDCRPPGEGDRGGATGRGNR